jgi:type IV secretion system protein VirD4
MKTGNADRHGVFLTLLVAGLLLTLWSSVALARTNTPSLWLRVQTMLLGLGTLGTLAGCLRRRPPGTGHGSAAFARPHDVENWLRSPEKPLPPGGILLGTLEQQLLVLPPPYSGQHGVIVGGSGTGKSFSFFLPNVAFAQNTSLIVTDPKSELWQYASGFHSRATRFAPTEPEASDGFNWIPLCRDARMAELCARAIVEGGTTERQEPPWTDLEAAFLSALFAHTATLSVPTPLTAYRLLTRSEPAALMERFLASSSSTAREQAVIFQQTHERMRGSITPVLAAKLQFLRDDAVARFTSSSFAAPDFGKLRVSPEAVFWCVREQDLPRLRPLSALFFTLLLEQIASETATQHPVVPVELFLDEFANIGVIPHFDTTISLARGRGVSIWLGIQSLGQLDARYSKPNARTILTNCATKIGLSGLDVETAEYFSKTLGQKTERTPRRTLQKRRFALFAHSASDTAQDHPRSLLTADEIRCLDTTEALVVTGNIQPLRIQKYFYCETPRTAHSSALGPAQSQPVTVTQQKKTLPSALPPSLPPMLMTSETTPQKRGRKNNRARTTYHKMNPSSAN